MKFTGQSRLTLQDYQSKLSFLGGRMIAVGIGNQDDADRSIQLFLSFRWLQAFKHQAIAPHCAAWFDFCSRLVSGLCWLAWADLYPLSDRQIANLLEPPLRPPTSD